MVDFKQQLIRESYERNAGYRLGYLSLKDIKKKMKRIAKKGKEDIKIPKSKVRTKDIVKLKAMGFKVDNINLKKLCGLVVSKRVLISWANESIDIGEELVKGNIGGVIHETIDLVGKVSSDIENEIMK